MLKYKVSSFDLKLALLQYFRFKRQCICVDEFRGADIIVDTGKEVIEIEVKITKFDLINGERVKNKHQFYNSGQQWMRNHPNKFFFCVPEILVDITHVFVGQINKNYGIIGFDTKGFEDRINDTDPGNTVIPKHEAFIRIAKPAKSLHNSYSDKLRWAIAMRASSKLATLLENNFTENQRPAKERAKGKLWT